MLQFFIRKPLFWILTSGIALAIIIAVLRLSLPNEEPFVLEPMSKEDLEVTIQDGKQIVNAKKDGYRLTLDPDLRVVTRGIESGRVMIFKGDQCEVDVGKTDLEEGQTFQQWFEEAKEGYEWEKSLGILDFKEYRLEKIPIEGLEAYYDTLVTSEFDEEKSITIVGKNSIYSISQSNKDPSCLPLEEILKSFSFR